MGWATCWLFWYNCDDSLEEIWKCLEDDDKGIVMRFFEFLEDGALQKGVNNKLPSVQQARIGQRVSGFGGDP